MENPIKAENREQKKLKVLLAEDEKTNITVMTRVLKSLGHELVTTVENGKLLLEELAKNKKQYDLIILDNLMPKMNGMEALRQIKEQRDKYGDSPVIMCASLALEDIGTAEKLGAFVLLKPYKPETLKDLIKKIVEKDKKSDENTPIEG